MLRIIHSRDDDGRPVKFAEYPSRIHDEATPLLAIRFDREVAELEQATAETLGVRRWTEATYRMHVFASEMDAEASRLGFVRGKPSDDFGAREFSEWVSSHPTYALSQYLATWLAVNLGGGHMTLLEVLSLPERDVEEIEEPPAFVVADPVEEMDAGKA